MGGLARIGAEKAHVGDSVPGGVGLGILDGGGDDLHPGDAFAHTGQSQSDGSHPAVEIQRPGAGAQIGPGADLAIEVLGLVVVDLVKGQR